MSATPQLDLIVVNELKNDKKILWLVPKLFTTEARSRSLRFVCFLFFFSLFKLAPTVNGTWDNISNQFKNTFLNVQHQSLVPLGSSCFILTCFNMATFIFQAIVLMRRHCLPSRKWFLSFTVVSPVTWYKRISRFEFFFLRRAFVRNRQAEIEGG